MNSDFSWQYTVWQHSPGSRGECINFGVTVKHIETGRVLTRFSEDRSRCAMIDPDLNEEAHRMFYPPGDHERQEDPGHLFVHTGSIAEAMSMTQRTPARGGIGYTYRGDTIEQKLDWAYDYFVSLEKRKDD
jgi:hypothetical protein